MESVEAAESHKSAVETTGPGEREEEEEERTEWDDASDGDR